MLQLRIEFRNAFLWFDDSLEKFAAGWEGRLALRIPRRYHVVIVMLWIPFLFDVTVCGTLAGDRTVGRIAAH